MRLDIATDNRRGALRWANELREEAEAGRRIVYEGTNSPVRRVIHNSLRDFVQERIHQL